MCSGAEPLNSNFLANYENRMKNIRNCSIFNFLLHRALKIQGDSVVRVPKLLSIEISAIEIVTWKFIYVYTYRERCKTGPAHNRCWNWSPSHIQAHLNAFLQIVEYFSQSVEVDGLNLLAYSIFELCRLCEVYFCTLCPSIGPKERSRHALDREIWVANGFFFCHEKTFNFSHDSIWSVTCCTVLLVISSS